MVECDVAYQFKNNFSLFLKGKMHRFRCQQHREKKNKRPWSKDRNYPECLVKEFQSHFNSDLEIQKLIAKHKNEIKDITTTLYATDHKGFDNFIKLLRLNLLDTAIMEKYDEKHDMFYQDDSLTSWLEYDDYINSKGKQGDVGLFNLKGCDDEDKKLFFKISQDMDYLTDHEFIVMSGLNELRPFCPHFTGSFALMRYPVDPEGIEDYEDPLISPSNPFFKDILLTEYIKGSNSLYKLYRKKRLNKFQNFSCIKQVCCAIEIAQREKNFSHYDLHDENVLITNCNANDVYVYRFDKNTVEFIPTYGNLSIIIDFGFSYIDDMKGKPLYGTMENTEYGFMTAEYDPIVDMKIFLIGTSYGLKRENKKVEKKKKKQDRVYTKFRRTILDTFEPLKADEFSGWDDPYLMDHEISEDSSESEGDEDIEDSDEEEIEKKRPSRSGGRSGKSDSSNSSSGSSEREKVSVSAVECVCLMLEKVTTPSSLFSRRLKQCISIVQSLITLPLKKHDGSIDVAPPFELFTTEFAKFEKQIKERTRQLYLLQQVVESAIEVRHKYASTWEEEQDKAVIQFKNSILNRMGLVIKYFKPKDVDYESLLCGILAFSTRMETFFDQVITELGKEKDKKLNRMKVKTPLEFFRLINEENESVYTFSTQTNLVVWDCVEKTNKILKLSENQARTLNAMTYDDKTKFFLSLVS